VIKLRKSFLLNDNKNWFIEILSKLQNASVVCYFLSQFCSTLKKLHYVIKG